MAIELLGTEVRTDSMLVDAVRGGDRFAFGDLYVRYHPLAQRFASRILRTVRGVDDVVAESFAKVLRRLTIGDGPTITFRPYLMVTVRTTAYKELAVGRMVDPRSDLAELVLPTVDPDTVLDRFEAALAVRAFGALPDRWQQVLRYTEVDGMTAVAAAELLGIQPNAVAALAFRARAALRVAYLQTHVNTDVVVACRESALHLAPWLCGKLHRTVRQRVQLHVHSCGRCAEAIGELSDVVDQIRRPTSPR